MNQKIVFVINKLYTGGAERQVVDDFNQFYEKGLNPILLTLSKEKESSFENELLSKENWHVIEFKNLFDLGAWGKAFSFFRKEKIDIIISHLWFSNTISRIAGRLSGVKKIIIFEQNIYDSIKNKKQFFVDWVLQFFTDEIIAVSYAVKDSLIKKGISEKRIRVLHNSVDLDRFNNISNEKILEFKKELDLEDSFIVTTIGRLTRQKNIEMSIKAISKIDNAKLLIIGKGELEEQLKKLVQDLGAKEKVLFLGTRNDIPVILKSSDCFVLTSLFEGLGIVILEAMASEKPVITTSFKVSSELIESGKNGLIIDYSAEDLILSIDKLKNDTNLVKTLSSNALDRVKDFSIEKHSNSLMEIINL